MQHATSVTRTLWVALLAVPLGTACGDLLSAVEPLAAVTAAVTADDAAASNEVDADADEEAAPPEGPPPDGEGPRGGGRCADGGGGRPGEREEDYAGIDLAACVPPVADGVDVGRGPRPRRHLAPLYDEDESGDLSEQELATLQEDVAAGCSAKNTALLADFDGDGDGALSQAEWDASREARRAVRDDERAALDTDGDGAISREEHEAAEAAVIAIYDADADGDLDNDERAAMREALQALVRAGERLPPLPMDGAHHSGPPPEAP